MTTRPHHRTLGITLAGLAIAVAAAACAPANAAVPSAVSEAPGSATPRASVIPTPTTSSDPTPAPTARSTPEPASPTPAPATPVPATPTPEPEPTDGGSDAMPITVDLETINDADVTIDIADRTGRLADARSGTPGDGGSVEPYQVRLEHVDRETIRLTWVDYPHDNRLAMWIDDVEGGLRIVIVQPQPTGPTDSIALDRVLELTFDQPIDEADIHVILQDGVDTPG